MVVWYTNADIRVSEEKWGIFIEASLAHLAVVPLGVVGTVQAQDTFLQVLWYAILGMAITLTAYE